MNQFKSELIQDIIVPDAVHNNRSSSEKINNSKTSECYPLILQEMSVRLMRLYQ